MRADVIVYEVRGYAHDRGARQYPVAIHVDRVGRYSSLEKAEAAMEDRIRALDPGSSDASERFHSWSIQEVGIDVPYWDSFYDERVYDGVGNFHGTVREGIEPFWGVNQKDCRFGVTDLVELICGGRLLVGAVAGLLLERSLVEQASARMRQSHEKRSGATDSSKAEPVTFFDQTDNSYRVLYGSSTHHHSHLQEARLFSPSFEVSRRKRDRLLQCCRYEQDIFRRFTDLGPEHSEGSTEIQLNSFVSCKVEEPYVVLARHYDHLVLSIESLTTLRGKPRGFKPAEIEAAKNFIRANNGMLIKGFREMLETRNRS